MHSNDGDRKSAGAICTLVVREWNQELPKVTLRSLKYYKKPVAPPLLNVWISFEIFASPTLFNQFVAPFARLIRDVLRVLHS